MVSFTAISPSVRPRTPCATELGRLARWALEQEAELTPKPALVDGRGSGAHSDMQLSLMLASARTLEPYFVAMAEAALAPVSEALLRLQIGQIGRDAETAMLSTTGGVNTHRGGIWALGLLVTAAARTPRDLSDTLGLAARLARLPDPAQPGAGTPSKGQLACRTYRLPGAREQAQQGFPHLSQYGLPMLRQSRRAGDGEGVARLNALLAIMSALPDTCVLSRAGLDGLSTLQEGARAVLTAGGYGTFTGRRQLQLFEQRLLQLNASAGGAADLLAATLLVDQLHPEATCVPREQ